MKYPIVEVVGYDRYEPLGTKQKFWFRDRVGDLWLFKVGRPGTGENWSEKVASELAALMGLPSAKYELAKWNDLDGVVSRSFIPRKGRLALGNEVLARIVPDYDPNETYKAREYRLETVCAILRIAPVIRPPLESIEPVAQMSALEVFIGFLVFDCWIGNPDRHHENWGFVVKSDLDIHLAPTFDHASGLGVRLLDDERRARLATNDSGFAVESYVEKAKTPFRNTKGKKMQTLEVVRELLKYKPGAVHYWMERIGEISPDQTKALFSLMPEGMMTQVAVDFALKVLEANRRRMEGAV